MNASAVRNNLSASLIPPKPLALLVLLENVGHIAGMNLPLWAMNTIDYVTEEYAKIRLWQLGAYRRYQHVVILEDAQATSASLSAALLTLSRTYQVDQLLLVHGQKGALVGHAGQQHIDHTMFESLHQRYQHDPTCLDLRMVYGLNCYGASLAPTWLALGAKAVNGAIGVNWLPEPSLSLFLTHWLRGKSFSNAVIESHKHALKVGRLLWPDRADGCEDPHITGSRQIIYGQHDLTIQG